MENGHKTPKPWPFPDYLQPEMDRFIAAYEFFLIAGQNRIPAIRWNTFVANRAVNEEAARRWMLI